MIDALGLALCETENRIIKNTAKLSVQISVTQRIASLQNFLWRIQHHLDALLDSHGKKQHCPEGEYSNSCIREMFELLEDQDLVGLSLSSLINLELRLSRMRGFMSEQFNIACVPRTLEAIEGFLKYHSDDLRRTFQHFWDSVREMQKNGIDREI
jgi:hypothetical protein